MLVRSRVPVLMSSPFLSGRWVQRGVRESLLQTAQDQNSAGFSFPNWNRGLVPISFKGIRELLRKNRSHEERAHLVEQETTRQELN